MEFYIKKNATLPSLKLKVIKDGRNNYNWFVNTTDYTGLFFSMVNVDNGIPKVISRPAKYQIVTGTTDGETEYYVYYQFQSKDTNNVGRYEGQFLLKDNDGDLFLPLTQKLYINVLDSFIADDLKYITCYASQYLCCSSGNDIVIIRPTPTPTFTPGPTATPTPTPTPTATPGPTPTPTPTPLYAYLFIEPQTGSTNIGQWMYNNGRNFLGFTNSTQPTMSGSVFNVDMNVYVDFSGWTNEFPRIITQTVPQTSGGTDDFGNSIVQYNFKTTEIPENYVGGYGWYTWIIPTSLTNSERQTVIDLNTTNNPNVFTSVGTETTINSYTFTYTGSTIPQTTYRVYTTYPNTVFRINDTQNIYMRGNTVEP